ncbi:MAG TPA: carbohydrate ABC transporter permease [Candidatus Sumerlaeota bacterium]|mgnify:FL=1|nr:MAG: L-arabinose transport system permease protein AraQ [candidate division BRC1 bacterium ADurb.Bin183]HOE64114.1 carbohydrate ABC transporter permease [Candidatus Sumerlaeota bacterium]HRR31092.1 carbohydrate ABC transporter permease [Candidatus Sumerlaeia bacterium]HON51315.1 carbohydrate ABC transporter permease [Candidatus Sumerlaeota bacterium]HOR65693.1 carbohydrate ABC transporter permease [Candidatus Sumerlaeota bacterium]
MKIFLKYLFLIALVIVFVGPFYWLVSIALRASGDIYSLRIIPENPTLMNFAETWQKFELWRPFVNSVMVAAAVLFLNILLSSLAAYPLARLKFPGRDLIFFLLLSTMMIPFQLYMIPLFLTCLKLGLMNSLAGIVLPTSVGVFGIYLIKQYYLTIPMDLEEAARIDGAGEFSIWWRIMFPLTKPAIATLSIFTFVGNWSNFLWPLIIIDREDKYTLPIAIAKLSGAFIDKTQYLAAGSVIAIAPVIIIYLFMQRYFISGISAGAVKG